MTHTLIIAEPGMTWDRKLEDAYRLIDAAKACGADVCKFQWTSSGRKLQERRKVDPKYIAIYERGVQYPREWLEMLKARCESVGIEFACTVYLTEDIEVIAPLVKKFKISAYESKWDAFVKAHYPFNRPIVLSSNDPDTFKTDYGNPDVETLWCVSKYPTPVDELKLRSLWTKGANHFVRFSGLSDHTANVLTGAAAVAAGAQIVEAHIRLHDTPESNPDYAHSLPCTLESKIAHYYPEDSPFADYVSNIRTVERML